MPQRPAAYLAIVLLGVCAYWGVWEFDFVSYDDPDYLSRNPVVQNGLSASGIQWAFTTAHAANWHPLTWISLQTVVSLFGASAAAAHAANLLLHLLASVLLFELFRSFGLSQLLCVGLASLFATHPGHVESVAWISEHKDVLSASLGIASLLAWTHHGRGRGRQYYAVSLACLAAGLLAKPMLVSWPLLFLLLNRWPLARSISFRRQLMEIAPMAGLSLGAGLATLWAQSTGGAVVHDYELGMLARLGNAAVSLWRYPLMLLWPNDLSFLYPHPDLTPALGGTAWWKVAASGAGILGLLATWRRLPAQIRTGLCLYLLMLFPTLGILQVGPQSHADRYSYLPSIGLLLILGWLLRKDRFPQRILMAAAVLLCIVAARPQVSVWRDDDSLYGHALRVNPDNWLAASNYAIVRADRGEIREAERLYRHALAIRPRDAITCYNLGTLYLETQRPAEAEAELQRAIEVDPRHFDALNNLSQIHAARGEHSKAVELLSRALAENPRHSDVETNLADSLRRLGRLEEAEAHLQAVLQRQPCHRRALDVLARLHFAHEPAKALEFASRANACPGGADPVILETLARVQHRLGDLPEALGNCERALELAARMGQSARAERLLAFRTQLVTETQ